MAHSFSVLARLVRVRLSMMVTFSALTGYFLTGKYPNEALFPLFVGLFLLSSGASVLNQVQESRQDALMKRTASRPIPSGEISMLNALLIAFLLIGGGAYLLSFNGSVPMILGLLNIVFYNLIYTPLKTRSWLAILPGAVVGGVPPMIGWTSAGLDVFHPNAIFLFIFVFLWQVPHFWLLMIKYGKEYERAGFSSISMFLDENQIKIVVFCWGVFTSVFLMLFPLFGFNLNPFVIGTLVITNLVFIRYFYRFLFKETKSQSIRNAFILINSYALVVFVLLIVNALIS
jgi:protoheme IX farnesyltransferase